MPYLEKIDFKTTNGSRKTVYLLPEQFEEHESYITVITGRNGSNKSRALGELVAALTGNSDTSQVVYAKRETYEKDYSIICISGTASDRFPAKDLGGRPTEFDLPNYVYIGQRVGANLLSKKQPLETLLNYALDPGRKKRIFLPFFGAAFDFANLKPELHLDLWHSRPRTPKRYNSEEEPELFDHCKRIAEGDYLDNKTTLPRLSKSAAAFLIQTFDRKCFDDLQEALSRKRRFRLKVSAEEDLHDGIEENVARLGLMCGLLKLREVSVAPIAKEKTFSAFELSSGEFHILTTILALGFACQDDAVVLIDEPENSLHPEWQLGFMEACQEIFSHFKNLHVVISTHSPLIVSAVKQGSSIVDMEDADFQRIQSEDSFGLTSDRILFDNFGVTSSRNPYVADLVSRAVDATELGKKGESILAELREDLLDVQNALPSSDPLRLIIEALIEDERVDGTD